MARVYPRLSIEEFGTHLLDTGDLDPVYVALNGPDGVDWGIERKGRFLVAYWCLYHCGAAAYLSDFQGLQFWDGLLKAARNDALAPTGERWPRGHERRHWRGQQAIASCIELTRQYPYPEQMVVTLRAAGHEYAAVSAKAQEHRGFGPWIAFKICDMLDRCLDHRVNFATEAAFNGIFKDPWEAAIQLWRVKALGVDRLSPMRPKVEAVAVAQVVEYLTRHFQDHAAPPRADRPVGVQEVETILCKWKSHMNGHYPLYNDINEIHDGLLAWSTTSKAVCEFQAAMPPRQGGPA